MHGGGFVRQSLLHIQGWHVNVQSNSDLEVNHRYSRRIGHYYSVDWILTVMRFIGEVLIIPGSMLKGIAIIT